MSKSELHTTVDARWCSIQLVHKITDLWKGYEHTVYTLLYDINFIFIPLHGLLICARTKEARFAALKMATPPALQSANPGSATDVNKSKWTNSCI